MVHLSGSDGTVPCPKCGRPRGMVTWTGDGPPLCAACSGATTTGIPLSTDRNFGDASDDEDLLDELLE